MTEMSPTQRILHSRRVLARYEQLPGWPVGHIEDLLAMIAAEIEVLVGIALEEPRRAETLAKLIGRWRAFADGVRAKGN